MSKPAWKFDTPLEQAGLTHSVFKSHGFEVSLRTHITLLRLHSLQAWDDLNNALQSCDLHLPQLPNQANGQDPAVLCLAPNDWLLFSEYLSAERLKKTLQECLGEPPTALTDQSSAYAVFRLNSAVAPWLLGKSCGLDFRKSVAMGQHCTRTRLDQVPAILHYHQPGRGSNPFVYDVIIERSLAAHTWQLFLRQFPHAIELQQLHGPFYEQSKLHP